MNCSDRSNCIEILNLHMHQMVSAQEGVLLLEATVPMALHTVAHTLPAATTALSTGVRAKDHLEDQANQAD